MRVTATRYHDFCAGHRVVNHESKCAHLHGHNYRVHITIEAPQLDDLGRVLDFSVIKERYCEWLEDNWDHKFLVFVEDPLCKTLVEADPEGTVIQPFNPTAENMGLHLLGLFNSGKFIAGGVRVTNIVIEETRKCRVEVSL